MDERARIEEKSRGIQEVITWRKFGSAEDIFRHEMHRHLEEEIKKREEKIKQFLEYFIIIKFFIYLFMILTVIVDFM